MVVTALDVPEDWDAVLRRADITAVIEARIAIEAEAAALAAERRTPVELRAMRRAVAESQSRWSGIEEHVNTDMAFHRSIVVAAHNPILTDLFDGFTPRSRQAMIEMLRIRGTFGNDADQAAHGLLLKAVADGDALNSAELSRAHLLGIKQTMG